MIYHNVSSGVSGPDHALSWLLISELQVMGRKIKHETWGAPITWRMPDPIPRWLFARSYVNQEKSGNCNHHPCGIIPSLWLFWRKTERKSCDIIDPLSSQQYTPANFHCQSSPVSMLSIWKLICQRKHPSWGRIGTNARCGPSFPLWCRVLPSASVILWRMWVGRGWAREIFIIISQLLTIYDKAQCWYVVCWRHTALCVTRAPTDWPPILSESIKTQVVSSCERPA